MWLMPVAPLQWMGTPLRAQAGAGRAALGEHPDLRRARHNMPAPAATFP